MSHQRTRLRYEILESRQLLAGDIGFSPWTHPFEPADVTGDSVVTAVDALVIINQLNRSETNQLADIQPPPILGLGGERSGDDVVSRPMHLDTNGDGLVTARDALFVINRLNRQTQASGLASGEAAAVNDLAIGQLSAEGEQTAETIAFSEEAGFAGDFGRASGNLSPENPSALFRFVATFPRVSVDLSSGQDEQIANVTILDSQMREIASMESQLDRKPFEGIDATTQAGAEYFIRVDYASSNTQPEFSYALSVYQFEPSRWLPPTGDEVITVGGEGDLPNTIAEATDVAIRTNGSSFVQQLESAGDVDVIRLPNGLPGSVFVSGLDGIAFDLLTENGEVLQPDESAIQLRPQQALGYFSAGQIGAIGQDSLFLRIFSTTDATGSYNVTVLFDNTPDPVSDEGIAVRRLLDAFDPDTAQTLVFEDNVSLVRGETNGSEQIDFYLFPSIESPEGFRAQLRINGDVQTYFQVLNISQSESMTNASQDSLSVSLPTIGGQQIAVAVLNSSRPSPYELTVELVARPVSAQQIDLGLLADAVPLPPLDKTNVSLTAREPINVAAGETVFFEYTAINAQTRFIVLGADGRDLEIPRLEIAFYDADGTRMSGSFVENQSLLYALMDRMGGQFAVADTDIGQGVFLRIFNPLGRSVALTPQIA